MLCVSSSLLFFHVQKDDLNDLYATAYEFMLWQFYRVAGYDDDELPTSLTLVLSSSPMYDNQFDLLPVCV